MATLAAAESASPVESLDVVARMVRDRLNAAAVSFLIVDFTGASVVRLGAADSVESDEPPERVALPGTFYADVLRTQRLALQREGSVTDAMGHDVEAALLATLAVGALRRARRAGAALEVQALEADRAVIDHGRRGFVTGWISPPVSSCVAPTGCSGWTCKRVTAS